MREAHQTCKRNCHNRCTARCYSSQLVVQRIEQRPSYHDDLIKRGILVKGSLGSGSYSKVKKAVDVYANFAKIAIKIIDKCHATKDYLDRFLPRELSIWIRLCHPNLIKLIDFFEENMRVYMVIEYAPGGDALNYIQKKGPLDETQAKSWLNQIINALSYMHSRNVAHRDLKLENLLLFDNCTRIKLCDFGFVKHIQPNNCLSDTFCGSKAYAAPEILSGQAYDPKKGDVWALGVVLFIIITGKMPFNETRGIKNVLEEQAALNLGEINTCFEKIILQAFTWNVALRPDIDSLQLDPWIED
ncbi:hypothetical protein HELRODRAFT_79615 [Helobdella robusta]|uniref:Protein kinase domain-containing protein n=1 Tax=Helobdella robusta TaxID=6412 RepID=T1G3R0_HELRO|nr:hypothetical protein HELRODRAFT_79615 [Helobdella robusta]ESO03855.1 hypothetical protein HELRODRAFT_79615 [Helobdella robusta]